MKKIFKKSLAIMVSAAICLTALIGCLSVSATNGDAPAYTVATVEGKKGETVDVNVTGTDLTEICGQSVNIIFASGLEIGKVHDNLGNRDLVLINDETGGEYNILSNEDGTKTVRLVDIINFPEYGDTPALVTASFDVTISVTIPADAVAGTEYPITIDESQFADYDEAWVYPTFTNGKITVVEDVAPVEDAITYTTATYDIAKSELVVGREAPSKLLKDKLSEATSAGNRKVQLVVDIDGTEFLFDVKITTGAGSFTASGFALTHLSSNISLYVRITADGDFLFETNAYNVVLADVVAEMAEGGDAKATALNELYSVWSTTDEILPVTNATIEEGAVDYTTVSYDVKKSEITIGRDVPSEELKQILSEASSNGNRLVKLVVDIGGAEYLFDVKITTGAGTFTTSGFALPHFTQDIKVSVRVISGASGEYVVNTNAVTVNLDSLMDTSVDSTFANAYNTFVNIQ